MVTGERERSLKTGSAAGGQQPETFDPLCLVGIKSLITREHGTDPQSTDMREDGGTKQRGKCPVQSETCSSRRKVNGERKGHIRLRR